MREVPLSIASERADPAVCEAWGMAKGLADARRFVR